MANEAVGDFLDAAGACAKPTERRSAGSHVPEMERSQMVHAQAESERATECVGTLSDSGRGNLSMCRRAGGEIFPTGSS